MKDPLAFRSRRPGRRPLVGATAVLLIGAAVATGAMSAPAAPTHPSATDGPGASAGPRHGSTTQDPGAGTGTAPAPAPRCPASDRRGAVSERAGATTALVPPGMVTLTLCRYIGFAEPYTFHQLAFSLSARRTLRNHAQVQQLADELNALPPPRPGTYSCPMDDASTIVARFGYPGGPPNPVTVKLGGCGGATNGHVSRASGRATERLERLVPAPQPATIRGRVEVCGGPSPGGCHIGEFGSCESTGTGAASCTTTDRVSVRTASGRRLGIIRLHDARFEIDVPDGLYVLRLLADGDRVRARVVETTHVRARARRTVTVIFRMIVP